MVAPQELLILVFDEVAEFNRHYVDQRDLTSAGERNPTLCACALVCRGWCAAAQIVLHRDICLGATVRDCTIAEATRSEPPDPVANPPKSGVRIPVFQWMEQKRETELHRTSFTSPSLRSLNRTLRLRTDLSSHVRSLHLGIGCSISVSSRGWLRASHGGAAEVADAISICSNLRHLSVDMGSPSSALDGPERPLEFSAEAEAMMKSSSASTTLQTSFYGLLHPTQNHHFSSLYSFFVSLAARFVTFGLNGSQGRCCPKFHSPGSPAR
ncbi:hypothetical protein BKA62DRAFT_37277 [Auriculariales sp. MPI-PUGE-AT-0066]|nr:hypothetical protein BKA62DRAFT_37277 [Auriculariales sp. MPI-PUGE-AT-0066]